MSSLPMSRDCVVCGRENPVGMKVRWSREDGGVVAVVRPQTHFQGFGGVLHGGLVCALLDDAMWWAAWAGHQAMTMTAEINVRYKSPVPVNADLTVRARVERARLGLFATAGEILGPDGTVLAEAKGKFLQAPPELQQQQMQALFE